MPEVNDTEPCPAGTYRDGSECVGGGITNNSQNVDPNVDPNVEPGDAGMVDPDMGTPTDAGSELTLPLAVDEAGYVPSGYFGDGETPGAIAMATNCDQRAGDEAGFCHTVTWTPGIGSAGFGGVFWQYPANNFGSEAGLKLPQGATELSFWAWGESGGEAVEFFSGLDVATDGYRASTGVVTLTDTPTQYTMSLCDADYDEVVSAFGWVAADATDPVSFSIDDIVMRVADEECGAPPTELALPFWLDDMEAGFVPSGFMGDFDGVTMSNDCPQRAPDAKGLCHNAQWSESAGSPGWAGVFWQYPENNWGELPGRAIESGATEIAFTAWGAQGGEVVNFGSGYQIEDGFARSSGNITLTTEPTEYTLSLSGVSYTDVRGGFSWVSDQAPLQIFIDDIHWR